MNRFALTLLGAVCMATTGLTPAVAQAEEILRFGTLAPEGSDWLETWYKVVDRVEAESPHPVEFKNYPGGVMGDEPDLVRKLKFGQLEIIGVTIAGISQLIPEILVLSMPFLFRSYEEVDHVTREMLPTFQEIADKRKVRLIAMLDQGMINLYSRHKIEHPRDIDDHKVWVWNGNPTMARTTEALGITGVPVPLPELMSALQTGLIDTQFSSATALVSFQWHTRHRYQYPVRVWYEPAAIIASKRSFQKVPETHREPFVELMDQVSRDVMPSFLEGLRKTEAEMTELMVESGIEKVEWSEEKLEWMRKKADSVVERSIDAGLFSRELYDQVRAEIAEYRKQKEASE